jgi:hypothetical protein
MNRKIKKYGWNLPEKNTDIFDSSICHEERGGAMTDKKLTASAAQIESRIFIIRGQKVMLDADLAELYGVQTKALNQAVKRNAERFPEDFMFQLTADEKAEVVTNCDHLAQLKFSRTRPYVFTEHGALMLGNVLKSARAVEVSLRGVRAFVHLRELVSTHKELSRKFDELERKVSSHDQAITGLINAIRQLMSPPETKKKRPIGFAPWVKK